MSPGGRDVPPPALPVPPGPRDRGVRAVCQQGPSENGWGVMGELRFGVASCVLTDECNAVLRPSVQQQQACRGLRAWRRVALSMASMTMTCAAASVAIIPHGGHAQKHGPAACCRASPGQGLFFSLIGI